MTSYILPYMEDIFEKQGVNPAELRLGFSSDMNAHGEYQAAYVALSKEKLYITLGDEKVEKLKGAKRLQAVFTPHRLEAFVLADMEKLFVERLLSTARLIMVQGEKPQTLLYFSIGLCSRFENLVKAFKNIQEGKDALADVKDMEKNLFCPECGTRYPEPKRKVCPKCLNKMSITKRLLSFFKDYRKRMVLIMFGMLAGTAFQVASPYIGQKWLFDEVLAGNGPFYGQILYLVLMLFAVRFLGLLLNMGYAYMLANVVPWLIYDVKVKIFTAMQRLSVNFYTSKQTGSLMNRVNDDANNIYWFFVDGLPYIVVNVILFIGVMIAMLLLNVQLALITLAVIPVVVVAFRLLWRAFRRLHHRRWAYGAQLNAMVSDTLNGQRVIKAFAKEEDEQGRFQHVGKKHMNAEVKLINRAYTAFPMISTLMFLGQLIVTAVGGMMVVRGALSLGTLMTFIAYLGMLYGPLDFMSWVSNWWNRCIDSAQRVFEIIDTSPDVVESENPVALETLHGKIDVRDVRFEYEPAQPVIKGMNLSVPAGKMLGIVGKTGAGKSTIANLMARLYDVTEGEIRIDDVNIKDLPLSLLRKNIGIVSQEIYLFIGSVADNIRYAKPNASMEEVIFAAKSAAAHDFIINLPDAYETRIGSGGQDLSGGERQRLSIARTLIQNPKILILDEATAAMDTETEMKIQESIKQLQEGRTTIAIAHRLSTLKDATHLAVIADGTVVEQGTHEELMVKKGDYYKLYMLQLEALKVINMEA